MSIYFEERKHVDTSTWRFPTPDKASHSNLSKEEAEKCKHSFAYGGGAMWCKHCGWFQQTDGRITKSPGGRSGDELEKKGKGIKLEFFNLMERALIHELDDVETVYEYYLQREDRFGLYNESGGILALFGLCALIAIVSGVITNRQEKKDFEDKMSKQKKGEIKIKVRYLKELPDEFQKLYTTMTEIIKGAAKKIKVDTTDEYNDEHGPIVASNNYLAFLCTCIDTDQDLWIDEVEAKIVAEIKAEMVKRKIPSYVEIEIFGDGDEGLIGYQIRDKDKLREIEAYLEKNPKVQAFTSKKIQESTEPNLDMSELQAKRTLGTLSTDIINGKKVNQYTANIYANLISKNLLPIWSKSFTKISISLGETKGDIVQFIPPKITQDFVARLVNGNETISKLLRKSGEIKMRISPNVFKTMENKDDAYHFFKAAVKYYDSRVEVYANRLLGETMKLGHNMKHLISNSKLSGLVTCPLTLLFIFDDVKMCDKNVFVLSNETIGTINNFVRNITTRYAAPEKEKKEIINDIKEIVKELRESVESIGDIDHLSEAVEALFTGGFEEMILESSRQFIEAQIDTDHKLPHSVQMIYENFGVKKLKPIPRDLIAYIQIETESIRDANDKMMISSYCLGKLEIVEWYIELIEVGSKKYIVPHNKPYLELIRTQLLACFKQIMDTKITNPADRPIIDIKYPKGYEG